MATGEQIDTIARAMLPFMDNDGPAARAAALKWLQGQRQFAFIDASRPLRAVMLYCLATFWELMPDGNSRISGPHLRPSGFSYITVSPDELAAVERRINEGLEV